jgi:hypothetical protein
LREEKVSYRSCLVLLKVLNVLPDGEALVVAAVAASTAAFSPITSPAAAAAPAAASSATEEVEVVEARRISCSRGTGKRWEGISRMRVSRSNLLLLCCCTP